MKKIFIGTLLSVAHICVAQLKTVYSVTPSRNISCANPALINNKFFFAGNDPSISGLGVELIVSDSSDAGTQLVKNIHTQSFFGSNPNDFTKLNSTQCVFWSQDATNGKELWVTDGTELGTNLIKDINLGSSNYNYNYFLNVGNEVYFMANDGTNGYELWKTDGTTLGTNMITNINATGDGMNLPSAIYSFDYYGKVVANIGNTVYFVATDGTTGYELWKTDGSAIGTTLVKDIYTGTNSSKPSNFVVLNNELYFAATTNAEGREIWKTDGTDAGTVLIKDLSPLFASNSNPSYLIGLNNKVYFSAIVNSQAALFETNGTSAGTFSVYTSPNFNTTFSRLTKVNNAIYFFESNTGSSPIYNLYKYDGLANTTALIKSNMFEGTSGAGYQPTKEKAAELDGMLYFTFDNSTNGDELWQSDGTTLGTKMITDIGIGSQTSWIDYLIPVSNGANSRLYFISTKKTGLLYIKADAVITDVDDQNIIQNKFSIFPNPAKEILNIRFDTDMVTEQSRSIEAITISIANLLGEIVLSETAKSNNLALRTNNLKSGVYFVTLTNKGKRSTQKIIIE